MAIFTGSAVALVTPFKNGKIDYTAIEQMIEEQIQQGTDALAVCGTTGEAPTLKDDEQIEIVRFAVKQTAGRIPVIAGAGSNDTDHAIYMSCALKAVGADALLLVTPYYNKCSQDGLIAHYTAIADAVKLPCILYSVPGRTGVNITPYAVSHLCSHPYIEAIKEASGNISQVADIAQYISDDFTLYSGNDDMVVPIMSLGGKGVISTTANVIPKDVHEMTKRFLKGDVQGAAELQLRMKPLVDALFCEVNPIPVKAALHLLGKIQEEYRLPLCSPSSQSLTRIREELVHYKLLPVQ